MLDVYRKFYHFTGEPFRLGPDHRFSLHHASYANAKAYLEYAIFQGEGFVTITGGPGTGKTTLISEILSVVDKDKIEVSTLTSTQLESRDLLHMVAHSFGIASGDNSKANLLLEIESFLVKKIRDGHRAILIVDEAQGLSGGALEELRLLANLQYKYQLLLQIVLVGQEQLQELIQQPAMEHLRQRMVAATSLEPLDLDETINYIEHRLSRVAWKGDPGIEEGALQLVYRYSGGVPRRINLIMNRLFLYGGMEEKHQYATIDTKAVIKGLVEEFLLPPDPLIDEANVDKRHTTPGAGKRPRYLPREPVEKPKPEKPEEAAGVEPASKKPADRPESTRQNTDEKSRIRSPRTFGGRRPSASRSVADMDVGSARRNQKQYPAPEGKTTKSNISGERQEKVERAAVRREQREDVPADDDLNKKKGGKGLFMVLLLLAGAGSAYLLQDEYVGLDKMFSHVTEMEDQSQSSIAEVDPKQESQQPIHIDAAPASEEGQIDRDESIETASLPPLEPVALAEATVLPTDQAAADQAAADQAAADQAAADQAAAAREAAAKEAAAKEAAAKEAAAKEAAAKQAAAVVAKADASSTQRAEKTVLTGSPAGSVAAPVVTAPAGTVPSGGVAETRRVQLRQDAEQRFKQKQANVLAKAAVSSRQESPPTVTKTVPPQKKLRITASRVKQTLLQGKWSSAGKPASLLPSQSTSCSEQPSGLVCNSVPQNVKTQYGLALYKVETKLSKFSSEGHFELAYRTLVRLVDKASSKQPASDDAGWQITEYSMSCTLRENNRVSCLDGKGITREYRRVLQ